MHRFQLYSWPTPNSYKVTILLRELGLPYDFHVVDISKGEQFLPDFLQKNPNNKIPVLVDDSVASSPAVLFESGCILEYLADKTQKFLPPVGNPKRYEVLKWLYWQMAGFGPMLGQNHHFSQYAPEKIPYAIDRYVNESKRLYKVLDHQLARTQNFVAGTELSIADFAVYPWVVSHEKQGIDLKDYSAVKKWFETLSMRPSVVESYKEGDEIKKGRVTVTEESRKFLFGQKGDHLK